MTVRVRFAPSPTGYLHVGGARTALINWLFAKKHGGTFILRIEDTDEARSTPEMTQAILGGLSWLGITWDEGPFFQSERKALYAATADKLLASGGAYRCFCTKEAIASRKAALAKPDEWKYDGLCRSISEQESKRRAASGEPFVIRCKVPKEAIEWDDIIKGPIRFEPQEVEDFILVRSDKTPTYHLSVVSDDVQMQMTHVIRGEDHISNTPKQIAIYRALGAATPLFGHLPLILGPDQKKLSKRHGVTSVMAYRDEGILPLALFNFLAQLGVNLGEEPYLTLSEIITRFDLNAVKKSASVFDRAKLTFINAKVISGTPPCELAQLLHPFLAALLENAPEPDEAAVSVMATRAKDMKDLAAALVPFLTEDFVYDAKAMEKATKDRTGLEALRALLPKLQAVAPEDWAPEKLETLVRAHAEESGVKAGALIHPIRVFLIGRAESPGIFDLLFAMGRERTLARLRRGLAKMG
ncbi:MAG: glutamate--tRNA ligase [Acidobacteria bacterium]|nr:glutamate--tRNA ligase [Acidobacteriota bacterium]